VEGSIYPLLNKEEEIVTKYFGFLPGACLRGNFIDGRWEMGDGRWEMGDGRWAVARVGW
jgi:hypothetical protein